MTTSSRFVVFGEDLPPIVASAFSAVGVASAMGALLAWTSVARADVALPPTVPSAVATPLPASASAVVPPTAAPSPTASSGTPPRKCPPLVINFRSDTADAPHAANAPLDSLAKWLVAHPSASVVVDGHADASGSDDGNLRLSRQRAAFVGATLEAAGAPKARITVRGFGSFWPVDEAPDASWNRRVVVQTKGEACSREKEEVIEP